jgi:flagellar biogenesis protein FliO
MSPEPIEISRQVLSVVLVFALLGGALWALRRGSFAALRTRLPPGRWRRSQSRPKSLRSLERLALSPQHSLHLIEMNGRQLLLAIHPQGCTLVGDGAAAAAPKPATRETPAALDMAAQRETLAQRFTAGAHGS